MSYTERRLLLEQDFMQSLREGNVEAAKRVLEDMVSSTKRARAKALVRYLLTEGKKDDAAIIARLYSIELSFVKPYTKRPKWLQSQSAES